MVVMVLEKVPTSLRGELTRWMIELKAGVFVGTMSAMVRDKLWEKVTKRIKGGGCMQLYPAKNEQSFLIRSFGNTERQIVDMDGLLLVCKRKNA